MIVGLVAGLITFSAAVDVRGDGACPAPSVVAGELQSLLAPEPASAPPYRAFVSSLTDSVHVDFLRADGSRLAERDLPPTGTCVERAKAAAAVIATWAGIFDRAAPPDSLPAPPEPATAVVATAAVQPAAAAATPSFWLGVGLLASWAGPDSDWVPSAEIAVRYAGRSRLGWRASLMGTSSHSVAVTPAQDATWSRLSLAIGPSRVWPVRSSRLEAHVQAAGSVLRAHGTGFLTNLSASGMAVGASTGLRIAFPWASGTPWLGIEGFYWQGDQRTVIESSFEQRDLPRIELMAGAGIGLGELR